jgi:phage tail sheath protein FI
MPQLKFGSAGVSAREIDLTGPVTQEPVGVPAGVIGTTQRGPAFVPVTVGLYSDFTAKFGETDGEKFGPLAVNEWLRNAGALTYVKVLGVGDGLRRNLDGNLAGSVTNAGFVVGEEQPDKDNDGLLSLNPHANDGGPEGRTYFLGTMMSESAGSDVFSSAKLQGLGGTNPDPNGAVPIVRGILMAPSGVLVRLSASLDGVSSDAPGTNDIASVSGGQGDSVGVVKLFENNISKEEFVLLLNGHNGLDARYPNVITASFDMTSPNYISNVLNTDPLAMQAAGHYLYTHFDVHPVTAVVTGSGVVDGSTGWDAAAFLLTGSTDRNVGSDTVPNYENFEDRFRHAETPWFTSQRFGGNRVNLFKLHALDDGKDISTLYKISIENIAPSTDPKDRYGSFDVVIRDWGDRDSDLRALEAWRGVNLDPGSDRYIAKIIGDAHVYFDFDKKETAQKVILDGQFPLNSNLVRVEVSDQVDLQLVDATAMPIGFRGHDHLISSGSTPMSPVDITDSGALLSDATSMKRLVTPPVPFRSEITAGSGAKKAVNPLLYWGVQFEHVASLATPNASTLANKALNAHSVFLPDFMTATQNVVVGGNEGTPDTDENGILDADRFNLGAFSLDNIMVVTGANGLANAQEWDDARYVRDGNITPNDTDKTRKVDINDFNQANRSFLKFSTFLQGGHDGVNVFDVDEAKISDNAVYEDMNDTNRGLSNGPSVRAYQKALDIMQSTTEVDIQLLAVPGIRHPIVTNAAIDAVENRFDALYIMDVEQEDVVGEVVTLDSQLPDISKTVDRHVNRSLDSSFAAAYYPDVLLEDPATETNLFVPSSVVVLGALALNDKIGHPWFAPAGFARGALPSTLESRVQLSKENLDQLYDADINPLTAFPGNAVSGTNPRGGVVVWGQKTLQVAASALDRVNVRRLLIDIRRQVRDIARTIVFEPNRETTLAKFSAAVTPRMERVQALAGIERFKVVIDSSTTTQQDVLNNTIRGVIFVQPTKAIEFVSLDFVVTNNIADQ